MLSGVQKKLALSKIFLKRNKLFDYVMDLVGRDFIIGEMSGNGWPGKAIFCDPKGNKYPISIFMGPIGSSGNTRSEKERRFQNPGSNRPIENADGRFPLLIGVWITEEGGCVLVSMHVTKERTKNKTRQSYFMPLSLLERAARYGYAEHLSVSGEKISAFLPEIFPVYVSAKLIGLPVSNELFSESRYDDVASSRLRAMSFRLVRDSFFRKRVLEAYGNECAMCGVGGALLEAAHVYPVSAADSDDSIGNGIALCRNHHVAFDRFFVTINPIDLSLSFNDEFLSLEANRSFVQMTYRFLKEPIQLEHRLNMNMLEKRRSFFESK